MLQDGEERKAAKRRKLLEGGGEASTGPKKQPKPPPKKKKNRLGQRARKLLAGAPPGGVSATQVSTCTTRFPNKKSCTLCFRRLHLLGRLSDNRVASDRWGPVSTVPFSLY